jgi:uncharacterized protein
VRPARPIGREWRDALPYCLLAFTITWLWWGVILIPHLEGRGLDRTQLHPLAVAAGMFGPMVAALFMRLFVSREGLRGSMGWSRSWRVYLAAVLLPFALGATAILVNHLLGLGRFGWAGENPLSFTLLMAVILVLASFSAIGEEYGWRGYLLPRLLPLGTIPATLLTGFVWGLWHLPLLAAGLNYPGQPMLLAIVVFVFSTSMLSFLFTGLYLFSRGSVAIAAVAHGALNALSELTSGEHIDAGNPLITQPFGLTTSLIVLIVVMAVSGALRFRSDFPAPR